jgi:hypothetical protein
MYLLSSSLIGNDRKKYLKNLRIEHFPGILLLIHVEKILSCPCLRNKCRFVRNDGAQRESMKHGH